MSKSTDSENVLSPTLFRPRFQKIDPKTLPPDYVITPGGPHHRSLVQGIEPGHTIDVSGGHWRVLDQSRHLVRELHAIEPRADLPGFGSGWVAFAACNLSGATPLSFLSTAWTVPPAPRTNSKQLLYLFNGFQVTITSSDSTKSGLHIFQPVLQWGASPDGGGPAWAVASWFVGGSNQPAQYTNPVISVNPGTTLTGVITLTSNVKGVLTYTCQFVGIPGTALTVTMTDLPFQCVETLEVYTVQQATDFPNTSVTQMRNIIVNTGATSPALSWGTSSSGTDSGQYAVVANTANPNGEIDLFYGYSLDLTGKVILSDTTDNSPTLASQNGMLFLGWRGSGNDNMNILLSADNGQTFINKLVTSETSDLAPSLAAHNGQLIIAWKGSGNDNLNIAQVPLKQNAAGTYDLQALANKTILGDTTGARPAIASHNGLLFLAWKGSGNDNLNVLVSPDNGHTWTGKMVSAATSSDEPSLVSHNGKLFIAWKGSGNDNLNVAQVPLLLTPTGWVVGQLTGIVTIGDTSSSAPALASHAGLLFLAWRGSGNNHLSVILSPDDGQTFVGKCIYGEASDIPPALAAHNGRLFLGWKGSGNEHLNVAQVALDGDLTTIPWEENLTGASGSIGVGHQATANQLDVIAVDQNGRLAVAWVGGEQQWNGPQGLTGNGFAAAGAPVALAHQTSSHQLDVLLVNNNGQVSVLWVADGGTWQGPGFLTTERYAVPGTHLALGHQTALNQLDAMFVDATGAVNVIWAVVGGKWQGPNRLTRAQIAPAGAPIALAHQTNTFQLDALFVDVTGALTVMWVVGGTAWQGPAPLTAARYAVPGSHVALAHQTSMNQLNAMFVDATGALNVMWAIGGAAWQGPVRLTKPGFAPAGAPVALAHQGSMDQLDAFVVDNSGALNVLWAVKGGSWAGPMPITAARFASPGAAVAVGHQTSMSQLDVFVPDVNKALQVFWVAGGGKWQGPAPLPGPFVV